ncbi:acetamidase/formamidase family protein [Marinococcus sp. PL1-022]|uniref:acetamidase/formamidase family protein n=1 Tax=Marinococcus sp. PL1-022 TaxID=3095363 RepID=UPI0029C4373B|nr:acetamidase/formamidase family protein [Marinococcus sp. PL1-022]MDX6151652.1 acetamidase/formamidase family protein [Marinococcus sp. PL1-022]
MGNVKRKLGVLTTTGILAAMPAFGTTAHAEETPDFPLNEIDAEEAEGEYYVPSSVDNIQWGDLPNRESQAVESIQSGETVTFDTVSHEGLLEDQGRDPVEYFSQHGIEEDQVLEEAKEITGSNIEHDFEDHVPHVVTGPVEVEGAQPGDVLKVEVMSLTPRVPYGVISNRHYKGAFPDEFPENEGPQEGASAENPELYNNVSTFTPIEQRNGEWMAESPGEDVYFPIDPFMGLMGVASDTDEYVNSVPPK